MRHLTITNRLTNLAVMICKGPFVSNKIFDAAVKQVLAERKQNQFRTMWLKNVVNFAGLEVEEAVKAYDRIFKTHVVLEGRVSTMNNSADI